MQERRVLGVAGGPGHRGPPQVEGCVPCRTQIGVTAALGVGQLSETLNMRVYCVARRPQGRSLSKDSLLG